MFRILCLLILVIPASVSCAYFGIGIHPESYQEDYLNINRYLNQFGFTSFRTDYSWSQVEKVRGVYNIPNIKTELSIKNLIREKKTPLLILAYNNKLYNDLGSSRRKISTDLEENGFLNYVRWVVKHFGKEKIIFEIWNEWSLNTRDITATNADSAKRYYGLVKKSSEVIKSENPRAIVIAGGFNPISKDDRYWASTLVKLGILNYIDGVSIHPYNYWMETIPEPKKFIDDIYINLHKIIGVNYYITPIYITEFGFPIMSKKQEVAAEKYAHDFFGFLKSHGNFKGLWWYDLIDDGVDKTNRENTFGILNYQRQPKKMSQYFIESDPTRD